MIGHTLCYETYRTWDRFSNFLRTIGYDPNDFQDGKKYKLKVHPPTRPDAIVVTPETWEERVHERMFVRIQKADNRMWRLIGRVFGARK